jgi:hypothetical protein
MSRCGNFEAIYGTVVYFEHTTLVFCSSPFAFLFGDVWSVVLSSSGSLATECCSALKFVLSVELPTWSRVVRVIISRIFFRKHLFSFYQNESMTQTKYSKSYNMK